MATGTDTKIELLRKKGLRTSKDRLERNFVGRSRSTPFRALVEGFVSDIQGGATNPATLGGFYESHQYPRVNGRRVYEAVYGGEDYSASSSNLSVQQALDRVYGDVPGDFTDTRLTSSSLSTALGSARAQNNTRPTFKKGAAASQAQARLVDSSEDDVRGLTLVGDFEAPIDPVV